MAETATALRTRRLKELEEKLAREKRMKALEDFKYKRLIEAQDKKYNVERPKKAKEKRSASMGSAIDKRNERLSSNQRKLQQEFENKRKEQAKRDRSKQE